MGSLTTSTTSVYLRVALHYPNDCGANSNIRFADGDSVCRSRDNRGAVRNSTGGRCDLHCCPSCGNSCARDRKRADYAVHRYDARHLYDSLLAGVRLDSRLVSRLPQRRRPLPPGKTKLTYLAADFIAQSPSWLKLDCRIWAINEYERRMQFLNTRNRAYQHPLCMPDACFGRSRSPINAVDSTGRRNTSSKSAYRLGTAKRLATFDSNATPFWLGPYLVQPDKAVLHREALWDQLIPRCCIDRLSWHALPDI